MMVWMSILYQRALGTGHTDHRPIKVIRLQRWDGKTWVLFGDIIEATGC